MAPPALLLQLFPSPWILVYSQSFLGPHHEGQSGLGLNSYFCVAGSQPLLSFPLVRSPIPSHFKRLSGQGHLYPASGGFLLLFPTLTS